jgi:RNA-directed DNA polymerase
MMHGRGKSDPVIGAVKPANKAAPTAAELVEQRPGAEGNASQQSAHRAQDRESVLQALERIRNVRRQAPEVRAVCINVHVRIGAGGAR